jgi:hypothetical protein
MSMQEYQKADGGTILMPVHKLSLSGKYTGQIIRDGKVVDEWEDNNIIVNQGLDSVLNVYLDAATQLPSWFLGVFEGNYTPVATDTAATIAGNSTECSAITNATRPPWTPAASSGQSITNAAARATFTFNATKTIYGAFLISNSTIGGTSGSLFSAARFATAKPVVNLDQLLLTYTFTASSV